MPGANQSAFPVPLDDRPGAYPAEPGMTLRDYFAAKALQGMLADLPKTCYGLDWADKTAAAAFQVADAMLKERDKCD